MHISATTSYQESNSCCPALLFIPLFSQLVLRDYKFAADCGVHHILRNAHMCAAWRIHQLLQLHA